MIERRFSVLFAFGLLTTIIKSCSAFGPNLRVIRLVSSLEIGFSMYQASCFISEFTMLSFFLSSPSFEESENGSSGFPNCVLIEFLLNQKLLESIESSTIYSELLKFPTFKVDPNNFPGKKLLQFRMQESTKIVLFTSVILFLLVLGYSCSFKVSFDFLL